MKKNNHINKFLKKIQSKPYIIAEIGVNHEGSIKTAKKMIQLAKKGGADAVKFQTYKAELLASKKSPAYWDTKKEKTKNQFELFKKYDSFKVKDYQNLYKFSKKEKIDFLSTPFDEKAVDFLDPLVPYFKIASADITNYPLLKKIAQKKKITFLSTGASNLKEIEEAITVLKKNGSPLIVLLHCILNYPTKDSLANLKMISCLSSKFKNYIIGYSDHTLPNKNMDSLTTAYLLGAKVLEKHFTINKKKVGNDHYHSMDYLDLLKLNNKIKFLNTLIGNSKIKRPIKEEEKSRKHARRSIVVQKFIKKEEKITEEKITSKRPGTGISPMNWLKVIGRKTSKNLHVDEIIKKSDIK
jgi:sialic acid synthase SpsE